ncbi:MAG: NADH-quinone oxidoreductase subunit G [Actinomycetota bacterium]|nr:NADH-quinone oxidoreductase subunit G [Actinomycetota bacterium]
MSDGVTLTIDGKELTVPKGTLIIRAAEQLGIEIPRFCDHPLLEPAGACRQCYVQIEGQPKLATSCTVPVAPGMVVNTQNTSEAAQQAQVANLEFLLLNHPLDCPVCDRGGECPLQDQALAFGPGESRFTEAKRTFPKPVPLSPLVNLDRERCVLCARCTRFCDEISGDRFIELFARGAGERVSIAAGEDFRSPFSGNTVQICPVGALTSTPYRFVARPFDLSSVDTVCPHCSSGCNVRLDVRRGEVVRVLARDNLDVNDAWICDKGRYAFRFADSPDRITTPLIRDRGLEPASFGEVLTRIAEWCEGKRVAILTGGRLMDEDYYALSKLARTVFGTNDLDHRRHGGIDAAGAVAAEGRIAASPMSVTYKDVEEAPTILVAGLDAEQESPILHLRLRKAARRGAKIFVLHPRRTRLWDVAEHIVCRPGDEASLLGPGDASRPEMEDAIAALREAGAGGVVLAGPRLAEHGSGIANASAFAARLGSRFAWVTRRANDRGALVAGVHPSLLPGGRQLQRPEELAEVESVWGPIMVREPGRGWRAILEACAKREVDVLFLIGVDPLRDYPDAALVRRALENVPVKVVQSLELGALEPYADAFLPAAAFLEKDGHVTTWEGRAQRLRPVRGPLGISLPDWEIFASLALAAGGDLGFETLDELHEEMGRLLAPRTPASPQDVDLAQQLDPGPEAGPDGSMVLFTYPLLIDEGRLSGRADELKAALQDEPFIEVHPQDAAAAELEDGGRALVRSPAGEAELDVHVTPHIAQGSAFVPYNQSGLAANELLSGSFTTSATLEPVEGRLTGSDEEPATAGSQS